MKIAVVQLYHRDETEVWKAFPTMDDAKAAIQSLEDGLAEDEGREKAKVQYAIDDPEYATIEEPLHHFNCPIKITMVEMAI